MSHDDYQPSYPCTSTIPPAETVTIECECGYEGDATLHKISPGLRGSIKGPPEPPTFEARCPKCGARHDVPDAETLRADREAGSRESRAPALPETVSASPSDHHRKLAEAIVLELGEQIGFSIRAGMTKEPIWPIVAAVLASEGVVDPDVFDEQRCPGCGMHRPNCDCLDRRNVEVERLQAHVEDQVDQRIAAEAEVKRLNRIIDIRHGLEVLAKKVGVSEGMERAAKIKPQEPARIRSGDPSWEAGWHRGVQDFRAAIRAAKEQGDG